MKTKLTVMLVVLLAAVTGCGSKNPKGTPPPMRAIAELAAEKAQAERQVSRPVSNAPEKAPEIQEPAPQADPAELYMQVLEKYAQAVQEQWDWNRIDDAGLNYLCGYFSSLSEIGYACMDWNGDGTDELFIGSGDIFDMYTVYQGKLVTLFQGGERSWYYPCTDNIVINEGSNSATEHRWASLRYQDGELVLVESIASAYDESEAGGTFFYSTNAAGSGTYISWEQAGEITGKYESTYIEIPLTPLSQLAEFFSPSGIPAYTQELSVISSGSTAILTLRNWNDGIWTDIFTANAYIGSNGVSASKQEGDRCTPAGTFDICFAFGTEERSLNISYHQIQPGDVWVCDPDSRFYNTLRGNDTFQPDWSEDEVENLYSKFSNDRSTACIYFNFNGDGHFADSAQRNGGSDLFIDGVGSAGDLTSGYGDIKISASDMDRLLELLDSSRNPMIVIS